MTLVQFTIDIKTRESAKYYARSNETKGFGI